MAGQEVEESTPEVPATASTSSPEAVQGSVIEPSDVFLERRPSKLAAERGAANALPVKLPHTATFGSLTSDEEDSPRDEAVALPEGGAQSASEFLALGLGCPFQRPPGAPKSPHSKRLREEAGARVVRFAAQCQDRLTAHKMSREISAFLEGRNEAAGASSSSHEPRRSKSLPPGFKYDLPLEVAADVLPSGTFGFGMEECSPTPAPELPAAVDSETAPPGGAAGPAGGAPSVAEATPRVRANTTANAPVTEELPLARRSRTRRKTEAASKILRLPILDDEPDEAPVQATPSRKYSSFDETVLIFDWDDTLFPTWFITEVVLPCMPEEKNRVMQLREPTPIPGDNPFAEALAEHSKAICNLLRSASAVGRVGIVTLSQRPWVISSAKRFMQSSDIEELIKELKIPIIYARESLKRPMVCQAEVEEGVNVFAVAKQRAMAKALKKLYGKAPWRNIISIGDSRIERDAIKELIWGIELPGSDPATPCCKTVKLMEEPSLEQLGAELALLGLWLRPMALHAEDFDIVMDDSEETMLRMHEQFDKQ